VPLFPLGFHDCWPDAFGTRGCRAFTAPFSFVVLPPLLSARNPVHPRVLLRETRRIFFLQMLDFFCPSFDFVLFSHLTSEALRGDDTPLELVVIVDRSKKCVDCGFPLFLTVVR